jgi:phospholipid/cholesterol/gamma-HCH transport system ATP-binding protein
MVEVRNLHKFFRGQHVLRGVDLQVARGEILVIIGRSGGGKSVLLKHLMGLLWPDKGGVIIDGVEISDLQGRALDQLRERFGVVFQGGALFDSLTVFENVAFPLREKSRLPEEAIREKTLSLLKQVGLGDMGHKYPAEVSGGMRKRVALARALTMDPEIILFDEPTTGLDPVMVNAIHRLILDLHQRIGFTAILVSHEIPEIFGIADRVAMLHEGRVIVAATPEAIQASGNPIVRQFITGDPEGPIQPQ